jgi:protein-disulfide isomerase
VVFEKQKQVGSLTTEQLATLADVPDRSKFRLCASDTSENGLTRIRAHMELGRALSVSATPTVIVNGWRFPIPPTDSELSAAIENILAGRKPFKDQTGLLGWVLRPLGS